MALTLKTTTAKALSINFIWKIICWKKHGIRLIFKAEKSYLGNEHKA